MIIQIKAMCEANGSILAATSYDDTNEDARAAAVIGLLEQVLARSDDADEQRLFTLDIEAMSEPL
ncbi:MULTISPECIES: hypothetical protein [Bradyrhizobium]|uniref:Uncharacterized protein n=1 Tax=Bradyrhizobium aeschynomenes TaxID=2734909 RepID=A0ABX2C808_9BRAD|nr:MULTISPECIES: hypothetical protein [unclassified Bradyrhizobium]NPU63705.1 hypothetical protein [Bradyrhizobium aeschynomenes]